MLIKDASNTVIYTESRRTRRAADKLGQAISSPPLNRYELRKV